MRLAIATATSTRGFRTIIRASHEPFGAPLRVAHRTTATAPTINSRRMSRCPIFEVFPRRSSPPLECWRGVSPTQAAKSRPFAKVSQGGAQVVSAAAVIGSTQGIVINRRVVSSELARRRNPCLALRSGHLKFQSEQRAFVPMQPPFPAIRSHPFRQEQRGGQHAQPRSARQHRILPGAHAAH